MAASTGPQVSYVATAKDGRCITTLVHDHVTRLTMVEAEQLRLKLAAALTEARRRARMNDPMSEVYAGRNPRGTVIEFPGGET